MASLVEQLYPVREDNSLCFPYRINTATRFKHHIHEHTYTRLPFMETYIRNLFVADHFPKSVDEFSYYSYIHFKEHVTAVCKAVGCVQELPEPVDSKSAYLFNGVIARICFAMEFLGLTFEQLVEMKVTVAQVFLLPSTYGQLMNQDFLGMLSSYESCFPTFFNALVGEALTAPASSSASSSSIDSVDAEQSAKVEQASPSASS